MTTSWEVPILLSKSIINCGSAKSLLIVSITKSIRPDVCNRAPESVEQTLKYLCLLVAPYSCMFDVSIGIMETTSQDLSSAPSRFHGYARRTCTSWRPSSLCSPATSVSPSINPAPTSGISESSMPRWRIRGRMNVKWILSRKSNYQLCSKWQVRMKNVREKFFPLFVPFTQFSSAFRLTRTIFRRVHIRKCLLSRSLIKFSRQLQFQKFSKNEFSPPPIVLMEKVRLGETCL